MGNASFRHLGSLFMQATWSVLGVAARSLSATRAAVEFVAWVLYAESRSQRVRALDGVTRPL